MAAPYVHECSTLCSEHSHHVFRSFAPVGEQFTNYQGVTTPYI